MSQQMDDYVNGFDNKTKTLEIHSVMQKISEFLDGQGVLPVQADYPLALAEVSFAIAGALERDLTTLSDSYNYATEGISSTQDNSNNQIRSAATAEIDVAKENYVSTLERAEARVKELSALIASENAQMQSNREKFEKGDRFFKRANQRTYDENILKLASSIEAAEQERRALSQAPVNAKKYHDDKVRDAEQRRDNAVAAINRDANQANATVKELHDQRRDAVIATARQVLNSCVTQQETDAYLAQVESFRPNYEAFEPAPTESFTIPTELVLGDIDFDISQRFPKATEILFGRNNPTSVFQSGGRIQIPLRANLANGLQLFFERAGREEGGESLSRTLRALTLRLLMAYPAGKLQLMMIDSVNAGMTFSGFDKIVDHQHLTLINGGVLTSEDEIGNSLLALAGRRGSFNTAYGRDKRDAYFQREAVQAVVISDFPAGFTQQSLAHLARLMENGEAFGMVFLIGMNENYIGNLKDNPDFKTILQRMRSNEAIKFTQLGNTSRFRYDGSADTFNIEFADEDRVAANEAGIIRALHTGVSTAAARKEDFAQLFDNVEDQNTWFREESTRGVIIPVGVEGAASHVPLHVGNPDTAIHHGLISGPTGAGKSTLFHTLIMSAMLRYSPEELKFILIDFKYGSEFRSYGLYDIPSMHSVTVATEPEFALAALQDLVEIQARRASMMSDLVSWRQDTGNTEPRYFLIFDEVQQLFASQVPEEIRKQAFEALSMLTQQGRAFGIHVFLASQSFERVQQIKPLMSDMLIRICFKGNAGGGIIEDAEALKNAPTGSAIINMSSGAKDANQLVQVCLLESDDRERYLQTLEDRYADDGHEAPRLLFTNIEDNPTHMFNAIVEQGTTPTVKNFPKLEIGSILKNNGVRRPYADAGKPFAVALQEQNLLCVGRNQDVAKSLFIFAMGSVAAENLARPDFDDKAYLFNFTKGGNFSQQEDDIAEYPLADLDTAVSALAPVVEDIPTSSVAARGRGRGRPVDGVTSPLDAKIGELYDELLQRKQLCDSDPEGGINLQFSRRVLFLFGVENALRLNQADLQAGAMAGLSTKGKLQELIREGRYYDMPVVVWGRTSEVIVKILEDVTTSGLVNNEFSMRIIFDSSVDEFKELAGTDQAPATELGAIFRDVESGDQVAFRPFDLPREDWMASLGEAIASARGRF